MNTGKQINAMVVVLFVLLVSLGAYSVWDPFRADTKGDRQFDLTIERAANTFALNCRLCHGDRGQGGVNGGRLPAAPALDAARLQGILDGTFSQAEYDDDFKLVTNTIVCGRVGTVMPTWGRSQGGTLSDEQVRQLATMITTGNWEAAREHADEIDAEATQHARVAVEAGTLVAGDVELVVSNGAPFTLGQYLRIQDERLRILPKQLQVERGVDGTQAVDHDRGTAIIALEPAQAFDVQPALGEPMKADATALVVANASDFAVGGILQLGGEQVRVTGIETGLPSTNQFLIKDIGREPKRFLVSGVLGIEVGAIVRIDGELLEVQEIRGDADPGIHLDQDLASSASELSVSKPTFFREDYVVRIGDELLRVGKAVDTEQTLGDTIGRAQTSFSITGTGGIQEGMVIRIGGEQMRITAIVSPTIVGLERAAAVSTAAAHGPGTAIIRIVPPADADSNATEEDTGQTLIGGINSDATSVAVTGSTRIALDGAYRLGDEIVTVTTLQPAVVRVERAAGGTEREEHARRSDIFVGNLFEVERGFDGSSAASHGADDPLLFTEIKVDREVGASRLEDHQKGDELYLGNTLIVQRGLLGTDAAEHVNGELVYNFPVAPDAPARTGANNVEVCGQFAPDQSAEVVPTPVPGAFEVSVELTEFTVTLRPTSGPAGPFGFFATNVGSAPHNLRIISTGLPVDGLPLTADGLTVDETQVEVLSGFTQALQVGDQKPVGADLPAGRYVLICNVPTHYESGMHTEFEVAAP